MTGVEVRADAVMGPRITTVNTRLKTKTVDKNINYVMLFLGETCPACRLLWLMAL